MGYRQRQSSTPTHPDLDDNNVTNEQVKGKVQARVEQLQVWCRHPQALQKVRRHAHRRRDTRRRKEPHQNETCHYGEDNLEQPDCGVSN